MNGFTVFARKEAHEILQSWRISVLPGILHPPPGSLLDTHRGTTGLITRELLNNPHAECSNSCIAEHNN